MTGSLWDTRLAWLRESGNAKLLREGLRGIEKETLRVDRDGRLSRRSHPALIGAALTHPFLTTDYSEALLEFVTPTCATPAQSLAFLHDLHQFVHRRLDGELLWPASMPCVLDPERQIPIARYGGSNTGMMKTVYRRGLGYRYGRAMQAIAGAHFNFSVSDEFWRASAAREAAGDESSHRSERYMGLVRNFRRHGWLVLYLFGASPALCRSFSPDGGERLEAFDRTTWFGPYATSLRMSDIGYRNKTQARLNISTNSLPQYIDGLVRAVTTEDPAYRDIGIVVDGHYRQLNSSMLQIENEYYSSIRPKPSKGTTDRLTVALRRDGVAYVEVRSLDLAATDPVGLNVEQLRFLEVLLVFCLLSDSPSLSAAETAEIDVRDLDVAREGRRPGLKLVCDGRETAIADLGRALLDSLDVVAALLDTPEDHGYGRAVAAQRALLVDPERTPSAVMLAAMRQQRQGFFAYVLELARRQHDYFMALPVDSARDQALALVAEESLQVASALEAQEKPPFAEFLRQYFARV